LRRSAKRRRKRDGDRLPATGSKHDEFDHISGTATADHLNQLGSARDGLPIGADDDVPCSHTSSFRRPVRHHRLHERTLHSLGPERLNVLSGQLAQHHSKHGPRRRSRRLRSRDSINKNSADAKDQPNKNSQFHSSAVATGLCRHSCRDASFSSMMRERAGSRLVK
jgi:hypothetical protein